MAKIPDTNYGNAILLDAKADALASLKILQKEIRGEKTPENPKQGDGLNGTESEEEEDFYYIDTKKVTMSPGGTWIEGSKGPYQVSNFPFFVKNLIRDSKDNVWRIVQIGNDKETAPDGEPPIFLRMGNDDFASAAKFRRTLLKQQKVFKGKDDHLFEILDAMPTVAESQYAETLGWNDSAKAYFFSNVAVKEGRVYEPNDFGLVNFAEGEDRDKAITYFMPYVDSITGQAVADDNALNFVYKENKGVNFNSWFQLMLDAHKHYCILPTCFMIASLFRDIIFGETHSMPLLFIKGVANSGKSSVARNLTAVFGNPQKEITLKSDMNTPKALARMLSQKRNALLWLDEWRDGINPKIQGFLQNSYDGAGYARAEMSQDNNVNKINVEGAICLTSNFLPTDDFFLSRLTLVQMNEKTKTQEQREAFKKLSDLERSNLSQISCEILQYRELIEKEFKQTYNDIYDYFFDQLPGVRTRFLVNMAEIIAPTYILIKHKKIRMVKLDYINELCDMARKCIKEQSQILDENSLAVEFWNTINILFDRRFIKRGVDFKFMSKKTEDGKELFDEFIAIRLNRINVMYQKEAGNKAKSAQEIKEMLETADYFVEKKNIRFQDEETGKQTSPTSAIVLNYQKLKELVGVIFE